MHVDGNSSEAVPRKDYVKVQTPQVFDATLLKAAYDKTLTPDMTDDASVAQAAGSSIFLFEGSPYNMKVTDPLDLTVAATLLDNI